MACQNGVEWYHFLRAHALLKILVPRQDVDADLFELFTHGNYHQQVRKKELAKFRGVYERAFVFDVFPKVNDFFRVGSYVKLVVA